MLQGVLKESDFAADLSQVLRGEAPDEYKNPDLFFANTYPTKGLKNVLKLVALRILGRPEQVGAILKPTVSDAQGSGQRRDAPLPDRPAELRADWRHLHARWHYAVRERPASGRNPE